MIQIQIFKMAFSAIRSNPLRSLLTTLGVVIGTGILILVLSTGAGIQQLIMDQLSSITAETLYVEIQVPSEGTRGEKDANTAQNVEAYMQVTTLDLDDLDDALDHYNIVAGYGMRISQGKLSYGSETFIPTIFGVGPSYPDVDGVRAESGRFYSTGEDDALEQVIVLGSAVKEELFGQMDAIGQFVKMDTLKFRVVGVMESKGAQFFFNMDEVVFIPIQTVQKKIDGVDHISALALQMEDSNFIIQTVSDLERIIRTNHRITDPDKDDFVVRTADQALQIVGAVTSGISALLLSIAAISLVVGGVGIMNVMYVSVSERKMEIGLRKALGAKPKWIRMQFLMEALVITVVGGALGAVGGGGLSYLISLGAKAAGFNWPFVLDPMSVFAAFLVSATVGLIFGFAPASKASKLDPVTSLRS
jgi:putative ABC transport system permease protein